MRRTDSQQNSNFTLGLVLLLIGVFVLLRKMGILFPEWLFSWPVILILVGVVVLVKNRFQSVFGFLVLLCGSYFLLLNEFGLPLEFSQYAIPVGLILLGLYLMIFRRKNGSPHRDGLTPYSTSHQSKSHVAEELAKVNTGAEDFSVERLDLVVADAVFCGIKKRVHSKNFQGGKISATFGAAEVDLRQADFDGKAYLNVGVAFGGIKLLLPPHWIVQLNATHLFAGIEDKRIYPAISTDPQKVLVISGTVLFGGLEIT